MIRAAVPTFGLSQLERLPAEYPELFFWGKVAIGGLAAAFVLLALVSSIVRRLRGPRGR